MQAIAAHYPEAERITLVMDNLNTHTPAALYETFPPARAKALWDRFECVHTPRHGSWLNMAEIEINVMVRQCLNRRIADIDTVRREVAAWQAHRVQLNARIDWQFTTDTFLGDTRLIYTEATHAHQIDRKRRRSTLCPLSMSLC